MRRLLLAVGLLVIVAVASGFGAGTGSLSQARVCGESAFSTGGARCIVDERAGVRSAVLHCSARTEGLGGAPYTGTFRFQGKAFPTQTGVVPGDGWVYTALRLPGGPFPSGRWSCAIDAGGTTATVRFSTIGDPGPLTSAAACPTDRTTVAAGVRACRSDLSRRPFQATSAVTCSGHYSRSAGHTASARLLYRGKPTGLAISRALTLPVSVLGMQVSRKHGLPAGAYACVFALDGKTIGRRSFSIAPAPFVPPTR